MIGNSYLFTGRRLDEETGLYYYRARYYNKAQGRFISRDPIGYFDGNNHYQYVLNGPTNNLDPDGLWTRVVRDGQARAQTCAERDGDPINILGILVRLTDSEAFGSDGWLKTIDGQPVLSNASVQKGKTARFSLIITCQGGWSRCNLHFILIKTCYGVGPCTSALS